MKIESPEFGGNSTIPSKFTCDGEGLSPELIISGVPAEAKSLVLIVDDPDAPGGDFVHWLVWGIGPSTGVIKEGEAPENAIQGTNSAGSNKYLDPCPPSGVHRYFFKLYALDTKIKLADTAGKEDLEGAMTDHTLSQAQLIGLYTRG